MLYVCASSNWWLSNSSTKFPEANQYRQEIWTMEIISTGSYPKNGPSVGAHIIFYMYIYIYVCMYVYIIIYICIYIYMCIYIYICVVLWDCVQGADPLRSSILVFYISCLTCVYLCILQQQSSYHGNPQQPRKRWCFGDFLWAVLVAKLPRYRVKIRYLKVAWY